MDITSFYELRTRLYATAASGCGLITEDFRLKRAVEAFEPMANVNKVFGRFYQMCRGLFTTDNVPGTLADCIALADALAVTQGTFQDNAECIEAEKEKLNLQPQKMLHSTMQELVERLTADKRKRCKYSKKDIERILDPRIFPIFIESLQKKEETLEEIAEVIFPKLGDGVIDLLKEKIDYEDTSAKNKTAHYVRLINRYYGAKENDWYVSLVENEENPKNIRIEAVEALGCSKENVPKLLEFYKTQKAAIKNQVLFVLAKLNPLEAEDIWKKLTEKYKDSNDKFIYASKSDICAEFVRKRFLEDMKAWDEIKEKQKDSMGKMIHIDMLIQQLENKYQMADCFSLIARKLPTMCDITEANYNHWWKRLNQMLISNLMEEEKEYETLIKEVYGENKEFYFPARLFLAFKESGEEAFEVFREELRLYRYETLALLAEIRYSPIMEGYYLHWNCFDYREENAWEERGIYLFEKLPESLLDFVTETAYLEGLTEKISSLWNEEKRGEKFKNFENVRNALSALSPIEHGIEENSSEYQRCVQALIPFAFKISKLHPIGDEVDKIEKYYTTGTSSEYIGLVSNSVLAKLKQGMDYTWELNHFDQMPMTTEDKLEELKELKEQVSLMPNVILHVRTRMLNAIENKITLLQKNNS